MAARSGVPEQQLDLSRALKNPDAWWTVIAVDPIAVRVLPRLARRPWVTPDRLSYLSLVLALAAGATFAGGRLVVGAVLFEAHFVIDCLDGKLARVRGTQNPRGGFVDLACDLVGTGWCFAALGFHVFDGTSFARVSLATAVLHVTYTWSTVHRSKAGDLGGRVHERGVAGWLARRRLGPTPYGVEVETCALFLVPLLGHPAPARAGLVAAACFFVVATSRNLRGTYRALSV
jgi:phosphatidylglycerophosphate synthase